MQSKNGSTRKSRRCSIAPSTRTEILFPETLKLVNTPDPVTRHERRIQHRLGPNLHRRACGLPAQRTAGPITRQSLLQLLFDRRPLQLKMTLQDFPSRSAPTGGLTRFLVGLPHEAIRYAVH